MKYYIIIEFFCFNYKWNNVSFNYYWYMAFEYNGHITIQFI